MLYSPLRYPGGKNKLSAFIAKICIDNKIDGHYVEPYSGGASVALFLLLEGFVKKITINDKDRSIYAFWHSVLNNTTKLCDLIQDTEVTMEVWQRQKEIQRNKEKANLLELGFSTFFLNRTNRSGIITAGVMGGNEQLGNYLMDCRFNKEELIARIKKIAKRKKDIRLYKKDASKLIEKVQNETIDKNVVFYFDPPYYLKAESLYMNHYKDNDHSEIAKQIQGIKNVNWIVSYDNHDFIQNLYQTNNKKEYSFNHSAYEAREGKEVLFFSKEIKQPIMDDWNPINFKTKKGIPLLHIVYRKTKKCWKLKNELLIMETKSMTCSE